ncbi:MAG: nitrite reductase small subunit NirD [Bacteroidota bacterium]
MESILAAYKSIKVSEVGHWYKAASVDAFPENAGACIKYKGMQIAVFNFSRKSSWYACQNLCPHKLEMVLSRGLLGDDGGIPKVACPLHKRTFSLETGENLNGEEDPIAVFPVKIEAGYVYIGFSE